MDSRKTRSKAPTNRISCVDHEPQLDCYRIVNPESQAQGQIVEPFSDTVRTRIPVVLSGGPLLGFIVRVDYIRLLYVPTRINLTLIGKMPMCTRFSTYFRKLKFPQHRPIVLNLLVNQRSPWTWHYGHYGHESRSVNEQVTVPLPNSIGERPAMQQACRMLKLTNKWNLGLGLSL